MRNDVNPTRMEMMRLKKKLATAQKGHRLLKDKLDELIRRILVLLKEAESLRKQTDESISFSQNMMTVAGFSTFPEAVWSALFFSQKKTELTYHFTNMMNLSLPGFTFTTSGSDTNYGFASTSAGLDRAMENFFMALRDLVSLAEKENHIRLIAGEIQKVRRRVNALEYILIPDLQAMIKFIRMKLDEQERNTKSQIMRLKDVVRAPLAQTAAYPGAAKYPGQALKK